MAVPDSGHDCCFGAMVIDTTHQDTIGTTGKVCETWGMELAERIAQALNAQEDDRKRLEVGPAVVYRDANQNALSATDGAKARELEGGT